MQDVQYEAHYLFGHNARAITQLPTALTLLTLMAGCGRPSTSCMSSDAKIIPVESGDAQMNAAMQTARDRFPEFWHEVAADYHRVIPALSGSMVKAYFEDPGGAPQGGEHMWVRNVEYDGKAISGLLADTPRHLHSVRPGQQVSFPLERLSDWFYVDGGMAVGAFTVHVLRSRMSEQERREHDSQYPFRFD